MSSPQLGILGHPEHRRVQLFCQAVSELGGARPTVVSYLDFLQDPTTVSSIAADLWRIESPGEHDQVARRLIALGGGPDQAELEFGQIAWHKEYHAGFISAMQALAQGSLCWASSPTELAVMFDKWECHQRFQRAGVARPDTERLPPTWEQFEPRLGQSCGRLFLKPLHGSSASGVCALHWKPGQVWLTAPLQLCEGRLFNSLRVRTYRQRDQVEQILRRLLPEGMLAERWIPKLSLPQGVVDLRVLVIQGRARHRVVRQSVHPMTNLHLGNRRGDESELRQHLGDARWQQALALAEQAAACFPDCLSVGVDLLLDLRGRAYVGEVNAFGDLLPGLLHEDDDAYRATARALLEEGPRRARRKGNA